MVRRTRRRGVLQRRSKRATHRKNRNRQLNIHCVKGGGGGGSSGNNKNNQRSVRWTYKRPASIPYEQILGKRGCRPLSNGSIQGSKDSCLPVEELKKIASQHNVPFANTRSQLCKDLGCKEDNDKSLLNMVSADERKRLEKAYFRPSAPEEWKNDPDAWLDNHSIEAVLKQYEESDPTFKSLGAVPIDFAAPNPYNNNTQCLLPEFCKLNLKQLEAEGKTGVGMVFNLDPHFKDGSHWVALYIDVKAPACYYFDSYGMKPPKQIKLLMETMWSQDPRCKLAYNGRRFQYSRTECGMYSLFFLTCMHYGIPFKRFVHHRVKDDVMLFLRSWFFNME